MNIFGLNQIIDSPTRISPTSTSLIDLILVTDTLNCTDKGTIQPFCSDHHAIYFSTNFVTTKTHCYKRKVWQYNNANFDEYRQNLNACNWDMDELSIDDQVNKLTSNMLKSAEKSIPNKDVTIRPTYLPWFHNEIRKEIRKRNRAHCLAKQTNTPENWKKFRESRNHVVLLIRQSKLNYFNKLATNLNQGNLKAKQWWKIAKQFLKQNTESNISLLIENNRQYSEPVDKANILNNYFCEQSNVDDSHAFLPPFEPSASFLDGINISETDVEDVLKLLDNNKACGPDLINPRLLKEGSEFLATKLSHIFNQSLTSSHFPSSWKLANVVPIFKKGDKTNSANYRPISLLSCIGKVFEKCVFKHLHNYLVNNNIIITAQSVFTPKDSAVYQLIDIYDTFLKALDEGKEVRAVFCDISKAFDRVWHRGLLFKLRRIGVIGPLLSWFESYLGHRLQRVVMEGSFSEYLEVKAGVPQGSILGPMLFLIYINDIVCDIGSCIKLFADDTTLYLIVEDPNLAANLMDNDLDKIHNWANRWLVKFNPQKTEEMLFSRKLQKVNHPKLTMDNIEIQRVPFHKHLGIIFNSDCSWHEHIISITDKAWKRIHLLRALKFQLDRNSLQTMYFSFIRPLLEYGDVIWDNCCNYEKYEIEKIQIEAGRIVTGATRSCSKSKIIEETGWDTLEIRRYKHRMITFYKMVKGIAPSYLQILVPPSVHQVSQRSLRNNDQLVIPRSRTNIYNKSFIPQASVEWNALPTEAKNCTTLYTFKSFLNRNMTPVPKYYYSGERKAQILHTRLRLHCSSLNLDLYNNHVLENDKCSCGQTESTEHYILNCTNYREVRENTLGRITVPYNIDILLEGCPLYSDDVNREIFLEVHNFILKTKRFD